MFRYETWGQQQVHPCGHGSEKAKPFESQVVRGKLQKGALLDLGIHQYWSFHKWEYPNSWMVYFMENPTNMDDLGEYFRKQYTIIHPYFCTISNRNHNDNVLVDNVPTRSCQL
jgi:hypothetical protein